jgi:hypothetical protein
MSKHKKPKPVKAKISRRERERLRWMAELDCDYEPIPMDTPRRKAKRTK